MTIADVEEIGIEKAAEIALEFAWKGADAVYLSFDVDSSTPASSPAPAGRSPAASCRARR